MEQRYVQQDVVAMLVLGLGGYTEAAGRVNVPSRRMDHSCMVVGC